MGKMPIFAKASHHLSKAFPICYSAHLWKEYSMVMRRVKAWHCMFEGGNLLNLNLTPVTNIPWKLCNFSQVVWLSCRAIFANISQIYYFIFEGTVSICIFLLQLGSICNVCVHSMCIHKKIGRSWLLFLHGPNIIITWVMQFIIFKHVV